MLPLLCVLAVMLAVNLHGNPRGALFRNSAELRASAFEQHKCNWHCHWRGCSHPSRLGPAAPIIAASNRSVVDALRTIGGDRFGGYQIANLMLFAAGWPVLIYALYVLALRQRIRLNELRREIGADK